MLEIGLYGSLFGQTPWKFLLDLSDKGAIKSNSHYFKLISRMKGSIKCLTAMRTPGKPCNTTRTTVQASYHLSHLVKER